MPIGGTTSASSASGRRIPPCCRLFCPCVRGSRCGNRARMAARPFRDARWSAPLPRRERINILPVAVRRAHLQLHRAQIDPNRLIQLIPQKNFYRKNARREGDRLSRIFSWRARRRCRDRPKHPGHRAGRVPECLGHSLVAACVRRRTRLPDKRTSPQNQSPQRARKIRICICFRCRRLLEVVRVFAPLPL